MNKSTKISAATDIKAGNEREAIQMPKRSIKKKISRRNPLSRSDWIAAARALLIAGGIEHVRIERLSEALNVTRGGFYWLFKSRNDLLNELLQHWERTNTRPFEEILDIEGGGVDELNALFDIWLDEKDYSPAYDSAVRDWARVSEKTARIVKRVDARRIDLFKSIFLNLGIPEDEAMVRARVAYYHQVGYYILGLGETRSARKKTRPLYMKILSGLEFD
jgi:AcrR family transcriptional regulator